MSRDDAIAAHNARLPALEPDDPSSCLPTIHRRKFVTARSTSRRDNRQSMSTVVGHAAHNTLWTVRRLIGLVLSVALVGTLVELVLLEHDETLAQGIPLVLLAAAAFALLWVMIRPRRMAVALFRTVMALLIAAGMLGLVLHFRANLEFQRDLTPTAGFTELFWKVMAAKAPPALAPAVLTQLGCLGLVYAYRLPASHGLRHANRGGGDDAIS